MATAGLRPARPASSYRLTGAREGCLHEEPGALGTVATSLRLTLGRPAYRRRGSYPPSWVCVVVGGRRRPAVAQRASEASEAGEASKASQSSEVSEPAQLSSARRDAGSAQQLADALVSHVERLSHADYRLAPIDSGPPE